MSDNGWYRPDDIDRLRMENELLAFEVLYLKSRIAEYDRTGATPITTHETAVSEQSLQRYEDALKDLRWILRRIDRSPLGWVLRRRSGFASLKDRWL